MLTQNLRKTTEYQKIKAAMAGGFPAVTALFGLPAAARAHMLAALCEELGRPAFVVCAGEAEATRFAADLCAFGQRAEVLPARDFVLRGIEGQNREYEYRRLAVLGNAVGGRTRIICAGVEAAMQRTAPRAEFCGNTLTLKMGADIAQGDLTQRLADAGYLRRFQVEGPGQFAVRGGIVDLYAPDMEKPCRLEFWGDTVESMFTFDLVSQRRDAPVRKIHLSPAREVLFGDTAAAADAIRKAGAKLSGKTREQFQKAAERDLAGLDAGVMPEAMDKYISVRYAKFATAMEYLEQPIVLLNEPSAIRDAAKAQEYRFGGEVERLLEEGELAGSLCAFYADLDDVFTAAQNARGIACENFARSMDGLRLAETVSATAHALPAWSGSAEALADDLRPLVAQQYAAAVYVGTQRAAAALARDLETEGIAATAMRTPPAELPGGAVAVVEGHLSGGVEYPFARLALITSRRQADGGKKRAVKKNQGLSSLSDITPGDYVVHQNHGIGLYKGIRRLEIQGVVKDYITIAYDKGATLYVPVTHLDVVSRYTAPGDGERVKLSKLGGETWNKTKARVKKATEEMAKELIELYAKREQAKGFAFPEDTEWQRDFEARFAYDETPDQLTSTAEIKKDMESTHPMDRLLCGDVGVGKTEVALRAAFKCVMGGKQVAILVPTTILAWQHYNTILSRMEAFPVRVELLSRFRTAKQQKQSLADLAQGVADIVVGTHRLLQKDVKFHDLGLVIVDEEQRFGVTHKEKLKELCVGVDMLTLSATPIPRTLNMAMSGLRDMSTIEEPPVERRPVETYVLEYDEVVIADALRRELGRGGQAYYLHNRIDTLDRTAARLAQLCPGARVETAHGKMDEAALSRVWERLLNGEVDILVCTTLIETGVDVRNCNTLIIEDADHMGLSQLYQLRGRVGRSSRKAYAYFTFRRDKVLNEVAAKRLAAIREFTSFGSGFRIAMRDLEIRGAGNLLGRSQHGHMEAVGYDMYVKMLSQAVAQAKGETPVADKSDCLVDITVDAYIPEKYIADASGRIEAYKRIAAIDGRAAADDVLDELRDRYGEPPKTVESLIEISLARITAARLGVYEITQRGDSLILYSDNLDLPTVKPLLKAMGRRVLVNAVAKPYLSLRVLDGEAPVSVLARALELMDKGEKSE